MREVQVRYVDAQGRNAVLDVPPRVDDLSVMNIARALSGTVQEREVGPWRHVLQPRQPEDRGPA